MMSPRRKQEPIADDDMTPSQRSIVEAAIEIFAERGYNGTATKDIAARAGVAEGTIFRYFPTKKELLIGAVAPLMMRALTPVLKRSVERVLTAEYESFEAFVMAFARDRLEFARAHPALLKLLVQELPFHPELRADFERIVFAELFPLVEKAIARFQKRGEVSRLPAITVMRLMGSVIVGFVVARVFVAPDADWDDDAELRTMASFLARGLAPS
jgi:AcrR family transcriptional regulator